MWNREFLKYFEPYKIIIIFIDSDVKTTQLQGETAYMSAIGLYDVDYKILVATRTGRLYIFSKSSTSGYKVEMTHAIVAVILRVDKFLCCTIDGLLQCYTLKVRLNNIQSRKVFLSILSIKTDYLLHCVIRFYNKG